MRALAIARRIIWQLLRDRRTLAMVMIAPLAVLGLMSLIFNGDEYQPKIAFVEPSMPADVALAPLRKGEIDAVVRMDGGKPHITVEGSDPAITRAVLMSLMKLRPQAQPEITYLHGGPSMSPFDNFGPVLLGFLIFFFTFIVSGIAFVRERTTGTLERMLATPVRRWEVVLGYLLGFSGVVIAQSALIAVFAVYALDMLLVGSFVWLALIVLLIAIAALTLGMLLSAWARTEFQVVQFIPIAVLPQVFFSGLFPMESMHPALRAFGRALPLSYAADAMRAIMIRGAGFGAIALDLAVLGGFSAIFLSANVVALRSIRRM